MIFLMWGWRPAFLFTGAIGLAWLILWFFVSQRRCAEFQAGTGGRATRSACRADRSARVGFILAMDWGRLRWGL
jgi:predicted MFS family arabinose efflux permease